MGGNPFAFRKFIHILKGGNYRYVFFLLIYVFYNKLHFKNIVLLMSKDTISILNDLKLNFI